MNFTQVMGLLGGLALFLYGMQMMSTGLEAAAGNKMKLILEKLTSNRFIGVLVGAAVTAVIQSSSATTVMVVGFVNSGMMTLNQAVWIIMGANVGTTITGQLIALDVGAIAPLIAFIGVAGIVFIKNKKVGHIGEILAGLGVLFIGMEMMSSAMAPLADSEAFVKLLTAFKNPILGILAGTVFTALIQSSSASVGILQALATSGVIGLDSAAYVLFGQNIGTCVTALLASVGTSRNAKRTTVIHVMFNVVGTVVFTALCLATPLIMLVEGFTPGNAAAQIANLHTLFNITTTVLLIPFGTWLPKLAELIIRDRGEKDTDEFKVQYLLGLNHINAEKLGALVCIDGVKQELSRMMEMAIENVITAFDVVDAKGDVTCEQVERKEEYVDYLNKQISKYITTVVPYENTSGGSKIFHSLYSITGNVERLSDHALNIAEASYVIADRKIQFSDVAINELHQMQNVCRRLFEKLVEKPDDYVAWNAEIASYEQAIDDMTVQFRDNMYIRAKEGKCSDDGSIVFSDILTDFERIGDHALNISKQMLKIHMVES